MPATNPFPLHKSHHTSGCQICLCIRLLWFPWDVTKAQGEEREECRVWHLHYLGSAHRCQLSEGGVRAHRAPCPVQTGLAWAWGRKTAEAEFSPFSSLNSTLLPTSHHCTIRGFLLQFNFSHLHTGVLICITPAVGTFLRIISQDTFNIFPVNCTSTCPAGWVI